MGGARVAPWTPPRPGGWREGDPVGDRRFLDLPGPVRLERGGELPAVRVAYETWGTLSPGGDNAVLVEHALTGDSHVAGPAGPGHPTGGWWDELVARERRWTPTGCSSSAPTSSAAARGRRGRPRPRRTGPVRVTLPRRHGRRPGTGRGRARRRAGIPRWAAVIGGSMGGMRVLEWAVALPERVERLLFLASGAAATADQVGTQTTQQAAIRADPAWAGGTTSPATDR